MAKRKEVDVDEDLIKSMMTGDIPRLNKEPVEEEKLPEKNTETEMPVIDAPIEEIRDKEPIQSKSKRRKEPRDYHSLFLKKGGSIKRQTYVSNEIYGKISQILSIIAKDISVPNFIDNVLENHLKEYKDEINDIYRNNSDLIL
ncbi:MAG: DUF3408 domain-containing protein [Dysgonomonas mossii]|uniref:DUF3408 domain-containing protein n=1 Tax=Dysgonomonas mossii TaxID=163665 RepID=UPI0039965A63